MRPEGKPVEDENSDHGGNEKLWTVAQAANELLPDGDKEKQLLQGLLNQRDKVEQAPVEGLLFS